MKNLTLSEFRDYLGSKAPICFVYSTANQTNIHSTLSITARYPKAKVSLNTMRIMFYGSGGGYLCLNRVCGVSVADDENADLQWIEFTCAGLTKREAKTKHRIIMELAS